MRIVRQFAKSDRIRSLFEFIKAKAPEVCGAPFDVRLILNATYRLKFDAVVIQLMNFREPLLKSLDATLDEAQLAGSSLVLDYI